MNSCLININYNKSYKMHYNQINYHNKSINSLLLIYKKKKLVQKMNFQIKYQIYKTKNSKMKKNYCSKLNSKIQK